MVDRADLVAELKRRYAAGGYAGISGLIETMLTGGQIHEPEFVPCQDCGADIERTNTPTRQQIRCDPCRRQHHNILDKRLRDGRYGR